LSKLAQLELARADYSDDIDAGYRAVAADTEYNREANANSEDRDSEASNREANANSEDRDSEASWLGLIIVTILTLAIVQWQPIPNIIAKQMLTPKTGTPKLNANSEDRDSEARNANSEDRDSEARHSIFLC